MKLTRLFLTAILTAAISAVTASCSRDGNSFIENPSVADIVVFESQDDNGAVFALSLPDNGQKIELSSKVHVNTDLFKPGECVYLRYCPVSQPVYVSGPVEIVSIQRINNLEVMTGTKDDYEGYADAPLTVDAAWGMLSRAIFYLSLPVTDSKQTLRLIINENTLANETPEAYLFHSLESNPGTFERKYYVAFDLSELRQQYDFKSLNINVADTKLGAKKIRLNF